MKYNLMKFEEHQKNNFHQQDNYCPPFTFITFLRSFCTLSAFTLSQLWYLLQLNVRCKQQ